MLFWLKKTLTLFILPLPASLMLGVVGCALLWTRRWQKAGRALVCLAFVVLTLASNKGVARWLTAPLESKYPPVPEAAALAELPPEVRACTAVAVLGGGHGNAPSLSRVNQLSTASMSRIAEAVRLHRLLPDARFIVCGHHPGELSHARVLGLAAISLGVPASRVVYLETPRDTEDEARELKRVAGNAPVALVTSASHMPRAMRLCQTEGVRAVACPAEFLLKPGAESGLGNVLSWELGALERSSRAIREHVGALWLSIRGK